jgi:tetratricopeptide (TPR) repeat protein
MRPHFQKLTESRQTGLRSIMVRLCAGILLMPNTKLKPENMKTINLNQLKKQFFTLACIIALATSVYSQTADLRYETGLAYRKERNYSKGLNLFSLLLNSDSTNLNYLVQCSYFHGRYGFFLAPKKDDKREHYITARRLAEKALAIDPKSSEAHYVYAMSLAYLAQVSDMKFRLSVGRTIKKEAELAVKLNPRNAAALHMLGRWHMVVAGFEGLQRAAVNCVAPELIKAASFSEALKYLTMAQMMEPDYKPHMAALAETYCKMDLDANAKFWINKAASLDTRTDEDRLADKKCAELAESMGYDPQEQIAMTVTKK